MGHACYLQPGQQDKPCAHGTETSAYRIPGMKDSDAQALLDELLERSISPERSYAHQWKPGDAIIWDNRCVLHEARPYDYDEVRIMQHTRIAGDPASDLVQTAPDDRADAFEPVAAE